MFSISRVSSIADLPPPVAICCHDAGGANLLAAWAADAPSQDLRICVDGPARRIFADAVPERQSQSLSAALDGAGSLLSGSGWASDLEHRARVEARNRGIPVVAVLDHWVNYRMRFVRGGVESLPDVLIVTDGEAAALAARTFGHGLRIEMWENRYLQAEVGEGAALLAPGNGRRSRAAARRARAGSSRLDRTRRRAAEFRSLDFLMANLDAFCPDPDALTIRLRPHPSEPASKYVPWLDRRQPTRLELSTHGIAGRGHRLGRHRRRSAILCLGGRARIRAPRDQLPAARGAALRTQGRAARISRPLDPGAS